MKSAGKARSNGLYRHIRTSKEIIRNLLNYSLNSITREAYLVNISKRGVAIISSAYVSGYEL